jgi:glucose-6-phosphate dehydrogenase assembly protein OpcA
VSEDVWSAEDTTPDDIEAALRELLRDRHAADRAVAPARVLNLIVVVDHDWKEEISDRLKNVGRYHASRTILCSVEPERTTLDATATMAYEDTEASGVHPVRERVNIDLGPGQLNRLDTIIDPILVTELPTMLWSPHGHDEAVRTLLPMVDVILLDTDDEDICGGLKRAAELRESAYVVDLAWLRTTPWRERLAASFDPPDRREVLSRVAGVEIRHQQRSAASAMLLGGWLRSRLEREMELELEPVEQDVPGLAGITVRGERGFELSLDRGRGGLTARERSLDGVERSWLVLGASRGEGGILGEGVRQALLRDPTYGPALASARDMLAA